MKKISRLRIKVSPKIVEFIRENSSDAAVFWWYTMERRKGQNGKRKKHKKRSKKTKKFRFTNEFIDTFLESSSDEDEGNVI